MKNILLIINYNDFDSTNNLINNVKGYKIIDKIIVVDNCSTDDSVKLLKDKHINVIKTESNKGYGYAINYGARYLIEKYDKCNIIISNPDIVIKKEEDIKRLISDLDGNGIVGPVISEHGTINRGWKIPSPLIDCLLNLVFIHRWFRKKYVLYPDDYYDKDKIKVEALSGCFFLINSDTLRDAGFFDEKLFLYYEENVISKKLQLLNKDIIVDTKVEIIHNHSVTIDKSLNKINKYKALKKSQYYFQRRYNNANIFERFLLLFTNKLSLLVLYVIYFIKDIM